MKKNNLIIYASVILVLIIGLFLRVYRVDKVLNFYFDQGRDALVIWDFWHNGKFFLVGPTTGIAGIFRGPFYYYLIAPVYLIGNGNPTWPAVFLAITAVAANVLLYKLAAEIEGKIAGLIAVTIASFSFYIVLAARWLSNPTPMLFLSMALIWLMFRAHEKKFWTWPLIAFIAGSSLFHFGSAGEVFYFLAILIFMIWQRKKLPPLKYWIISALAFFATFAPLLIFDLRHDGILRNNIFDFLFSRGSFKTSFWDVAKIRFRFYYDVFTNKLFDYRGPKRTGLIMIMAVFFVANYQRFLKNDKLKIVVLFLVSPMIGLLFFQGNYGNIYDYYLTGYYLIFILFVSVVLARIWQTIYGKVFVIIFFYYFFTSNFPLVWSRINDNLDGETSIGFKNQLEAIDWIYKDANGENFNVDFYVPPVIPYAYDYLFNWLGSAKYDYIPDENLLPTLYTLYEEDPPHPERLEEWMKRQDGIGVVEKSIKYGGITVQKRVRYEE